MNYRYYIFTERWEEVDYTSFNRWNGKKIKSAISIPDEEKDELWNQEESERSKLKSYYASGMSLINGSWQSCGWTIDAHSFAEAAQIAEKDETFRIHRLSDNVNY